MAKVTKKSAVELHVTTASGESHTKKATPKAAARSCTTQSTQDAAKANQASAPVASPAGAVLDRRQRKTRRAIYAAFESLMANNHYSDVTVAQIIDAADIGRSTFYAHFETKDELLHCICTEMFDHIFEGVNEFCTTHSELETANLAGKLAHLLYHLRDTHSGVCGKLIQEGEPIFARNFRQRLAILIADEAADALQEIPDDLKCEMLVSAFCQAVAWWFNQGAKTSPETVAAYYVRLIP